MTLCQGCAARPNRDTLFFIYLDEFRGEIQDLFTKLPGLQQGQIKPAVCVLLTMYCAWRGFVLFWPAILLLGLGYSFPALVFVAS